MLVLSGVHEPQKAPDDACETWLERAEFVASSHDYMLESSEGNPPGTGKSGLVGRSRRGSRLDASCEPGHAQLRIVDAEGSSVSLEFSGTPGEALYSFQMTGDFPGLGQIARTHLLEEKGSEIEEFTNFSAATADGFASIDLAPDGSTIRFVGDANRANASFVPKLTQSIAWKDANLFLYGLAGMLEGLENVADETEQAPMDGLFPLAIPTPHSEARDLDAVYGLQQCSGAAVSCVAAIFLGPTVGALCYATSINCYAAAACYAADCAGDG